MKRVFLLLLLIILINSCNKNGNGKFERRIEELINESCKNKNCLINISKVTSFKWSKLYVFKETASLKEIETVLNQTYPYYSDVARRIVFLDERDKIVYHEEMFPNVEGVMDKEVIFYISDTMNYNVFNNPNFVVTFEKLNQGFYYILNQ